MYKDDFINTPLRNDAVLGTLSHSVMLISRDTYALKESAKLLAQTLMCQEENKPCSFCAECMKIEHNNNVDVMNFPQNNKVINSAEIANIIDLSYQAPYASDKKIFILNNIDSVDVGMQNKLLKTLEEPPKNTYFILLATSDNNILQTIKSRCRMVYLPPVDAGTLTQILSARQVDLDKQKLILHYAEGNCSLALNYAESDDFLSLVSLASEILGEFRKSSQMLDYAFKLYKIGDKFEDFLSIFLKDCADAVKFLTLGKTSTLIAQKIACEFSVDALAQLVKNVGDFVERKRKNCNFNALIDEFLFMILEVRHKWPI